MIDFKPSCGGPSIATFEKCKDVFDASWCSTTGYGEKLRACNAKAAAAVRKPLDDANAANEAHRAQERVKALREQCSKESVLPKPAACKEVEGAGSGLDDLLPKDK
ncbi:hypothetical protein [Bradyrhizobium sp. Rc2d]|uniref:hypothetical protein n=1 Tax=Bradyrhizobium sp. Rc2d TaxID=1855321 RepID=UPI00115FA7FC|nr:hypothetical protein [Bradyrhizobium sp. Rc2d]